MTWPTLNDKLISAEDCSVNFVYSNGTEARYVRRLDADYAIAYLSSHTGCNKACRFCHLTQTGQTTMEPATAWDVIDQLKDVVVHYNQAVLNDGHPTVSRFHINWMARGEPLLNAHLADNWDTITQKARRIVRCASGCTATVDPVRHNMSTIMPVGTDLDPYIDSSEPPVIYYSLYSVNPTFRKRWLPNAMNPIEALDMLAKYQSKTSQLIRLHWAFIDGQNDSEQDVHELCEAVRKSGLKAKFNLVRYNPFSASQGVESSPEVLQARFNQVKDAMVVPGSEIISRVGFDVKASCGMFVSA